MRQKAMEAGEALGKIARQRFPNGDESEEEPLDINYLAHAGLIHDNPNVKQYYLERILELSGGNFVKEWKSGINPKSS